MRRSPRRWRPRWLGSSRRYLIVATLRGDARCVSRPARLSPTRARPHRGRMGGRLGDVLARPGRRRARSGSSPRRAGADPRRGRASGRCRPSSRPSYGALCIFEYFYLARPDSSAGRRGGARRPCAHGRAACRGKRRSRRTRARQSPTPGSRPRSASRVRSPNIPFSEGLIKNRYVGRTFIQSEPGDAACRALGMKYQPSGRGGGQARRRSRRLDRARKHDAPDRADALRGRRHRGARAHLVATRDRAVLLRDRPRRPGRDDRLRPDYRGDSRALSAQPRSPTSSHEGLAGVDATPGVATLPRVPDTGEYPTATRPTLAEAEVRAGARSDCALPACWLAPYCCSQGMRHAFATPRERMYATVVNSKKVNQLFTLRVSEIQHTSMARMSATT